MNALTRPVTPAKPVADQSDRIRTIEWISVDTKLPDAELLVLIALNDDDTWTGFHDGAGWRYVDAMPIAAERVTDWAHMPEGPGAAKSTQQAA